MVAQTHDGFLGFLETNVRTRQGGIVVLGQISESGLIVTDPHVSAVLRRELQLQLQLEPPEFKVIVHTLSRIRGVKPVEIVTVFLKSPVLRTRLRPRAAAQILRARSHSQTVTLKKTGVFRV